MINLSLFDGMSCGQVALNRIGIKPEAYYAAEVDKPNNRALSRLVGAPASYLDSVSQRKAEELTGNGWTVDVISHVFSQM